MSVTYLVLSHLVNRHAPRDGIVGILFPKVSTRECSMSFLEGEYLGLRM